LLEALLDVVSVILVDELPDVGLGHLLGVLVVVGAHQVEHFAEVAGVAVAGLASFDQLL